jgi:diphthamide synthase (EF-2-diphthine--ammonia ligase)
MNQKYNRVSMHATRLEILYRQAELACLPIQLISLPDPCTNDQCDVIMRNFIIECCNKGIERMAFGDLFLEDVRQYRENQLKGTGIEPVFPLWQIPTAQLADQMLAAGLEALVSSVDLRKLPARCVGRKWSWELLNEFPKGTDLCGENGEIHTVVIGGPMFRKAISVRVGEIVERDGFAYADIIPMD